MNITRRGDTFQIRISGGKDSNGKRVVIRETYSPNWTTPTGRRRSDSSVEKEVQLYALDLERMAKEGRYSQSSKMTFCEFAQRWRDEWAVTHLSENVLLGNWRILEKRVFPAIGSKEISKIRPLDLQALVNSMQEDGLKPKTIKRQFSVVSSVFSFAERMEVVSGNPCRKVELPADRNTDQGIHYFTVDQAKRFLAFVAEPWESDYAASDRVTNTGTPYHVDAYKATHCTPLQYQAYFMMAVYGGFRRGELVALRWCDIDFDSHIVNITRSASRGKDGCFIKEPKTAAGIRSLTLPESVFRKLREWRVAQLELSLKLGPLWEGKTGRAYDENFIFIQLDTGRMMDVSTPTAVFRKIVKRYNDNCENEQDMLPAIRLHDLRHSAASLMIDCGISIPEVSRRLGHSRTSVTMDVYSHAMPSQDKAASEALERAFEA